MRAALRAAQHYLIRCMRRDAARGGRVAARASRRLCRGGRHRSCVPQSGALSPEKSGGRTRDAGAARAAGAVRSGDGGAGGGAGVLRSGAGGLAALLRPPPRPAPRPHLGPQGAASSRTCRPRPRPRPRRNPRKGAASPGPARSSASSGRAS
jgi:hypothetical protein